MKLITRTISYIIAPFLLILALYSCKNDNSGSGSNYNQCEDSLSMYTKSATTTADTAALTNSSNTNNTGTEAGKKAYKSDKRHETESEIYYAAIANEPTGPGKLVVTSTAFANMGTIPVKYTCDGQGATPPIHVSSIPAAAKSLALIVHDYNATPEGGMTFWIIWNLGTDGNIPEDFRNNHENMNIAHQYGNTPLCAKSGNHKYHFIVYALDTKLVIGKNTTKASIENVMRGHVLAKGELVGIYNKQLE